MSANATIFKAFLNIADLDRHYFAEYHLTVARHPSETDERMIVRLLGFILYADDQLGFGKGLCMHDEPDLVAKNYAGDIECWMIIGQPDEKQVRKACSKAEQVVILSYGAGMDQWWRQSQDKLRRLQKVTVWSLQSSQIAELADHVRRTMRWHCTIQDGSIMISDELNACEITPALILGEYRVGDTCPG